MGTLSPQVWWAPRSHWTSIIFFSLRSFIFFLLSCSPSFSPSSLSLFSQCPHTFTYISHMDSFYIAHRHQYKHNCIVHGCRLVWAGGGCDFQESGTPFGWASARVKWTMGRDIFIGGQGGIAPLEFWQPKKVQNCVCRVRYHYPPAYWKVHNFFKRSKICLKKVKNLKCPLIKISLMGVLRC